MNEYSEALLRLKNGRPKKVPKGTRITNDAVSLEAGKKKGSIKKSRPQFHDLIADIDAEAAAQKNPELAHTNELARFKAEVKILTGQLSDSRGRELSLVWELHGVKRKLAELTGEKVVPIRALSSERKS